MKIVYPYQIIDQIIKSESKKDKNDPVSTGINEYDIICEDLRGKLFIYAGYAGAMKSMLAIKACVKSLRGTDACALYLNLEMGSKPLLYRILDMTFKSVMQYSKELKQIFNQVRFNMLKDKTTFEQEIAKYEISYTLKKDLHDHYGERFMITEEAVCLTDIEKLLENTHADLVVIDGVSMLGDDDETGSANKISKRLKELSLKYNLFIIAIVHCSKGLDKTTRDVSTHLRGSEKIVDNADAFIMFSRVLDQDATLSNDAPVYMMNKIWLRLWDKRNSGIIKDLVCDFDPFTLTISENPNNRLEMFENKKKRETAFR